MVTHSTQNTYFKGLQSLLKRVCMVLLLCLLSFKLTAQVNADELKGAIILHLCENIEWPEYTQNEFTIGFLSSDRDIYKALKSIESSLKIHKKKVKLIEGNTFNQLLQCNAVYFKDYDIKNINQVFDKARENNILLITDDYNDPLNIHVNLIQEGTRMAFSINMSNLTLAKLEAMPNILLNGGSVVDIKTAFEEFDARLQEGRDKLQASERELQEKEELLKSKDSMIADKEAIMRQRAAEIDSLSIEAQKKAELANQQRKELEEKEVEIKTKNSRLELIYKDIEDKQQDLNILKSDIAELDKEAGVLRDELSEQNKVLVEKDEFIKNQSRLLWLFIGLLGAILITAFTITRFFFIKRNLSIKLQKANHELEDANEELNTKNEIINKQNHELNDTLENLKETQTQLIQAEKMASLGTLTDGIAHEINNPLNFILGGFLILKDHFKTNIPEDSQEIGVALKSIDQGVVRATNIVKGLNALSGINEDFNESCSLNYIIDNCLIVVNNIKNDHIAIIKNYQENLPDIQGNSSKLHQVFLNILSNAAQALGEEGEIKISTSYANNKLSVEVLDNGCGISEENLGKVTDPFFSTKPPGEGTGLGLSISYNIIKEHSGELTIESETGKYTRVVVELPIE